MTIKIFLTLYIETALYVWIWENENKKIVKEMTITFNISNKIWKCFFNSFNRLGAYKNAICNRPCLCFIFNSFINVKGCQNHFICSHISCTIFINWNILQWHQIWNIIKTFLKNSELILWWINSLVLMYIKLKNIFGEDTLIIW